MFSKVIDKETTIYLPHVSTQSCEIIVSENLQHSETCIVIDDKSQGSVATHLRCGGILILNYYKLQLSVR